MPGRLTSPGFSDGAIRVVYVDAPDDVSDGALDALFDEDSDELSHQCPGE
jgi:hypothetical protein